MLKKLLPLLGSVQFQNLVCNIGFWHQLLQSAQLGRRFRAQPRSQFQRSDLQVSLYSTRFHQLREILKGQLSSHKKKLLRKGGSFLIQNQHYTSTISSWIAIFIRVLQTLLLYTAVQQLLDSSLIRSKNQCKTWLIPDYFYWWLICQ